MQLCAQALSRVWVFGDLKDCSPTGSSVHGNSQARRLEWVAISYSRESSQLRDGTCDSCISSTGFTFKTALYDKSLLLIIRWYPKSQVCEAPVVETIWEKPHQQSRSASAHSDCPMLARLLSKQLAGLRVVCLSLGVLIIVFIWKTASIKEKFSIFMSF